MRLLALLSLVAFTSNVYAFERITDHSELDFTGYFDYAVNFHGHEVTLGDARFTNQAVTPGLDVTGFDKVGSYDPDHLLISPTPENNALELITQTFIWRHLTGNGYLDLAVEPGQEYRLQLLFAEHAVDNRNFIVTVEGEILSNALGIHSPSGLWINTPAQLYAMTDVFTAEDSTLNIDFIRNGEYNFDTNDSNPFIAGLTLERVVPTFGTVWLLLPSLIGLGFFARRRNPSCH